MIDSLSIKILCDNTASGNYLGEHGLSFLINTGDTNILFDTGKGEVIAHNMQEAGIKPSDIDLVVFSHGHYDHTGGISYILNDSLFATKFSDEKNRIYMHADALNAKYSKTISGPKYIGISKENKNILNKYSDITVFNKESLEILPGVHLTGEIPRINSEENVKTKFFLDDKLSIVDSIVDDQSLFIKTPKGIVVILGCCHSGLANTLDYISKLANTDSIYAVIGGTHLRNANRSRLDFTIEVIKKYNVKLFAPIHCSGQRASAYMFAQLEDIFQEANSGAAFLI